MSDTTWTEVPAPDGRRCWVAYWCGEVMVLTSRAASARPWMAQRCDGYPVNGDVAPGATPREALDGIGCDLPAPDVDADTAPADDRPPHERADLGWTVRLEGDPELPDGEYVVCAVKNESSSRLAVVRGDGAGGECDLGRGDRITPGTTDGWWVRNEHITDARPPADAEAADEPPADDDPAPTPEPPRFKVGDWIKYRGVTGIVARVTVRASGHVAYTCRGSGATPWFIMQDEAEPTTRPNERWARALDPQPDEEVTDDRGRRWEWECVPLGPHGWKSLGNNDWSHRLNVSGRVYAEHSSAVIATLPDTLRGLGRLNAASDVLDRHMDALPDGVVVTEAWRERCADTEPRSSGGDAVGSERDDRPVMAWWVRRDYRALVSPQTGRVEKLNNADPHPLDVAKVMGWRAVEVSHD